MLRRFLARPSNGLRCRNPAVHLCGLTAPFPNATTGISAPSHQDANPMSHVLQPDIKPALEVVETLLSKSASAECPPNLVPLCAQIPADLLTPTLAYLRISAK